jgi:tRNA dimethylallyltransferase
LHNSSDFDSSKRAIRAIEIAEYTKNKDPEITELKPINSLVIGIDVDREVRRAKITKRLKERMNEGMIEEVKLLMDKGVSAENLIYYGLEYKFVTQYLTGELSYKEMFSQLEIAIHQFAKRQMTWFRGMERRGFHIEWMDSDLAMNEKICRINELLKA